MSFETSKQQPISQWPPSPHLKLWKRLEELHAQLGMDPPTATLTIEQLDVEVAAAEAQLEGPRYRRMLEEAQAIATCRASLPLSQGASRRDTPAVINAPLGILLL